MGDPSVSQDPQLKRFSGRDYHSQDTSGPFAPPDTDGHIPNEVRRRVDDSPEAQMSSERPQTADYVHTEWWYARGASALRRRTSWDGSPVVQRDLPAYFKDGLNIELRAFGATTLDAYPSQDTFEYVHNQADGVTGLPAEPEYQHHDDQLPAVDQAFAAPEAAETYWPPEFPLPPQHIRFDDARTMESRLRNENGLHEAVLLGEYDNDYIEPRNQALEQGDYEWVQVESDLSQPLPDPEDRVLDPEYQDPAQSTEFVDPFPEVQIDPFPPPSPAREEHVERQVEIPAQLEDEPAPPLPAEPLPQIIEEPALDLPEDTGIPGADSGEPAISVDQIAGDSFAKLLRRLRRKMDELLEKRISWQNEQQKLERRWAFLKASLKGMREVIEAERVNGGSHGSLGEPKKETSSGARHRTDSELQSPLMDGRPKSAASAGASHAATASDLAETTATSISFSNYEEALTQVQEDEGRLVEQEDSVKALGEQISNLEFHIKELSQEITKQMSSGTFIEELRLDMLNVETTTQASEPEVEPEDNTPEVVRKYFDWMGEQGIHLERLQELDYDHNEVVVQREFFRDRGDEPDVSDEDFRVSYRRHREDITTRLDEAREKVAFFYKLCREAGIDPESYRRVTRTQYSGSVSRASRSAQSDVESRAQVNDTGLVRKRSLSPPGEEGGHKLELIEAWRKAIPTPSSDLDASVPPTAEQPHNRTP